MVFSNPNVEFKFVASTKEDFVFFYSRWRTIPEVKGQYNFGCSCRPKLVCEILCVIFSHFVRKLQILTLWHKTTTKP